MPLTTTQLEGWYGAKEQEKSSVKTTRKAVLISYAWLMRSISRRWCGDSEMKHMCKIHAVFIARWKNDGNYVWLYRIVLPMHDMSHLQIFNKQHVSLGNTGHRSGYLLRLSSTETGPASNEQNHDYILGKWGFRGFVSVLLNDSILGTKGNAFAQPQASK